MADFADLKGQHLGNYLLVRRLGRGASSEVYLGEHIHLRTLSAIRVLNTSLTEDDEKRFLREARVLAKLSHPNILPTLDFGVVDGKPFIVMGYAPNGSLRERHPKGSKLPLTTVLSYTKPVAAALQYAHEQTVIHRDVKPGNMLLSSRDDILLSNFGFFSITQSSPSQTIQEVAGTITYMAPEQIQGMPTPASDQYSLGVVIYEWLCGERPFRGSFTEIATQHVLSPPQPLHGKVLGILPEVEEVVMIALAKNPQQRFKSVQAFANALEQAVGSRPRSPSWPSQPAGSSSPSISEAHPQQYRPTIPSSESYPSYANQAAQSPYSPPPSAANYPPYGATQRSPELPISPPDALAKRGISRGISRRAVLVGLVGIVGLAAAEAVTAITSSRTPRTATPTPTLPKNLTYLGHSDEVNTVAWSPDGKLIASGSRDKTARVWNSSTGNTTITYSSHRDRVFSVAWSPNGQLIASASADRTVQVWNAITGQPLLTYSGHSAAVFAVAWSPNGKLIASASLDGTVQVWDASSGNLLFTYKGHSAEVLALAWSPDSLRIASASADKTVQVWDAATGMNTQIYSNHSAGVTAVEWSPDGQYIASGSADKTVRVWDAATIGKTFTFTYAGHSDRVSTVAWSRGGKLIASGSDDRTVQVWNTSKTFSFTYRGHSNWVYAVAWSPVDRLIASASADKTVRVWQAT